MRAASLGHVVFAVTMIIIGVMGFASGNFAPIWQPVPKAFPARELLIFLTAAISVVCGAGLLWQRAAASAAAMLFVALAVWMVLFKVPFILRAPAEVVSYESCGETAVLVAAAWVLYAWFAGSWEKRVLAFIAGDMGVSLARILYGAALIAFGSAHFAYVGMTAPLVPGWLPAHEAWAYFTGAAYIAAGVAIVTGVLARLAAALVALQIGLITVLVWIPVVMAGHVDPGKWGEFVVSCALTAGALVLADSYRGAPWFGVRASATVAGMNT